MRKRLARIRVAGAYIAECRDRVKFQEPCGHQMIEGTLVGKHANDIPIVRMDNGRMVLLPIGARRARPAGVALSCLALATQSGKAITLEGAPRGAPLK